jgi:hypothetical protein
MMKRKRGSAAAAVGLLELLRHRLKPQAQPHGRQKSRNALKSALRTLALISVARQVGFRRAGRMLMLLAASGSLGQHRARQHHR